MTSRRGKYKNFVDELQKGKNRGKARACVKVERPFRLLRREFGFEKAGYRGLKKNCERLCTCVAQVNLYLHRKRLAAA
jgi:IS5 family transposase